MKSFTVIDLTPPEGVSGNWYGVQDSKGNIVYTSNQWVKADDKAKILTREAEQNNQVHTCVECAADGTDGFFEMFDKWYCSDLCYIRAND